MSKIKESVKPVAKPAPVTPTVDTPTHSLTVKGKTITFIDKKTKEKISKTYPTAHAVRIICGRAPGDPGYLHSVVVKIKSDNYRLKLR